MNIKLKSLFPPLLKLLDQTTTATASPQLCQPERIEVQGDKFQRRKFKNKLPGWSNNPQSQRSLLLFGYAKDSIKFWEKQTCQKETPEWYSMDTVCTASLKTAPTCVSIRSMTFWVAANFRSPLGASDLAGCCSLLLTSGFVMLLLKLASLGLPDIHALQPLRVTPVT